MNGKKTPMVCFVGTATSNDPLSQRPMTQALKTILAVKERNRRARLLNLWLWGDYAALSEGLKGCTEN